MSTGNKKKCFWGLKWPVRGADNITAIYDPIVYTSVGQHNTFRGPNLIYGTPSGARYSVSFRGVVNFQDMNTVLKLVVCILLRVLGQVQGFRLTQHWVEYFI
jgi:hypothetical protein